MNGNAGFSATTVGITLGEYTMFISAVITAAPAMAIMVSHITSEHPAILWLESMRRRCISSSM